MDENGVWLAGFSTTAQPAAIAGPSLCATRLSGKLNGEMAPTTPIGTRRTKPIFPSPAADASSGTTSPASWRAAAALNCSVETARCASIRAVRIGLAASSAMHLAKSSVRRASAAAARSRISARLHCGRGSTSIACRAALTARSTSVALSDGTEPSSAPL